MVSRCYSPRGIIGEVKMEKTHKEKEDKYEIIIKKLGREELIETDVMGDRETQEILRLIGELNLRSAFAG
jgi:hypothetical protein